VVYFILNQTSPKYDDLKRHSIGTALSANRSGSSIGLASTARNNGGDRGGPHVHAEAPLMVTYNGAHSVNAHIAQCNENRLAVTFLITSFFTRMVSCKSYRPRDCVPFAGLQTLPHLNCKGKTTAYDFITLGYTKRTYCRTAPRKLFAYLMRCNQSANSSNETVQRVHEWQCGGGDISKCWNRAGRVTIRRGGCSYKHRLDSVECTALSAQRSQSSRRIGDGRPVAINVQ